MPDVYSTPSLRVGIFRCPPEDTLWHETNDNIGERPHVVFPGTAVGLVREGMRLTATPNDVVFYRPFETYERSLRDARGDVCLFIAPARARRAGRAARARPTRAASCSPAGSRAGSTTRLFVEETAAELIGRAIRGPAPPRGPPRRPPAASTPSSPRRPRTCCSSGSTQPLSLTELAGELHVSPYHLTRVFRERTGRTLTEYLHDLRLRAAVERLGEASLSRLAADLGYAARRTSPIASARRSAPRPRNCAISWKRRRAAGRRTAA